MEEKERYELESYNEAFCQIHDTESNEWYLRKDLVKDLLNQQDKRIKELETKLAEMQNEKAIRELEEVKGFLLEKIAEKQSCFDSGNYNDFADGVKTICELMLISIDNQIKSLKGEK